MKKIMSLVLAVAVLATLFVTTAFAAGSKEDLVEITEVKGATVTESKAEEVKEEEVTEALAQLDEEDRKAFEELGLNADDVTVTVLKQVDIEVKKGETATLTVEMEGVEDEIIAVFLKTEDGTMKLLKVGVPPLEVETEESGTLVAVLVK